MSLDPFRDGAVSASLENPADIDLLIVTLVEKLDGLTKTQVLDAIAQAGAARFFDAAQCLENLVTRGALHAEGGAGDDVPLHATANGRAALVVLGDNLPRSIAERTMRCALRAKTRRVNAAENIAEIRKTDGACALDINITVDGQSLFRLSLAVEDELQAGQMRARFLAEPEGLYNAVLAALL
ncbi:MAG: DUF4364 family protein [Oscillospiraceae bacterium]|jgi:hypothetical protein|nr:DUF4364 family protein [Oscillospiraceae bacterium]